MSRIPPGVSLPSDRGFLTQAIRLRSGDLVVPAESVVLVEGVLIDVRTRLARDPAAAKDLQRLDHALWLLGLLPRHGEDRS